MVKEHNTLVPAGMAIGPTASEGTATVALPCLTSAGLGCGQSSVVCAFLLRLAQAAAAT